ncbi:unnamed protein product, partial [Cuscuta epithymum]
MFLLEEAQKNQQHGNTDAAMVHVGPRPPPPPRPDNRVTRPRGRNPSRGGRNRALTCPEGPRHAFDTFAQPGQWPFPPWSYWPTAPWAPPPCPYPAVPWNGAPPSPCASVSILGPAPHQAHLGGPSTTPTDITAAIHTMPLSQPDPNWYMDTGATTHMTSSSGTLTPYFNTCINARILVGNGHSIPVLGHGHTTLSSYTPPLYLNNVLHAPQ